MADRRSCSPFPISHSGLFVATDVVYFDGAGGQRIYVIPSQEMVIVRTGKGEFLWDDAIIPKSLIRGVTAAGG